MKRMIPAAVVLLLSAAPVSATSPVTGRWLTDKGKGMVEIAPCGANVCGRIIKLIAKVEGPPTDRNNPDPALRSRPLLGLPILSGFRHTGKQWEGTIYDPERGKSFRSILKRNPDGTLAVKGCIGPFCQTQTWKPAG